MQGGTSKGGMELPSDLRRVQDLMKRLDQIDKIASVLPSCQCHSTAGKMSNPHGLRHDEPTVLKHAFRNAIASATNLPTEQRLEPMARCAIECLQGGSRGGRQQRQHAARNTNRAPRDILELRRELGMAARNVRSQTHATGYALPKPPTAVGDDSDPQLRKFITLGGMKVKVGEEELSGERPPQCIAHDDIREMMRKAELMDMADVRADAADQKAPHSSAPRDRTLSNDTTPQSKASPRRRGSVSYTLHSFKEMTEDASAKMANTELTTKNAKGSSVETRRKLELAKARRLKRAQREVEAEQSRIDFGPSLTQRQAHRKAEEKMALNQFETDRYSAAKDFIRRGNSVITFNLIALVTLNLSLFFDLPASYDSNTSEFRPRAPSQLIMAQACGAIGNVLSLSTVLVIRLILLTQANATPARLEPSLHC